MAWRSGWGWPCSAHSSAPRPLLKNAALVIFTSDNGGLSTAEGSPTSNLPLRAGKGWAYEGGGSIVGLSTLFGFLAALYLNTL